MNLLSAIIQNAPHGKIALQDDTGFVTYDTLPWQIAQRAGQLRACKCAAIAMNNSSEWVLWDLAALSAGVPLVPLPPFFTEAQRRHALQSAGCDVVITMDGLRPLPFAPVTLPRGTAKITFTSGTTGAPRGVCLPESGMYAVATGIVSVLGPHLAGAAHMCVLPLAVLLENIAGVYAGLLSGCTIHLPSLSAIGTHYEGLHDQLQHRKASSAILVPEILRLLMRQVGEKGALPHLRYIAVGGSKVAPALIDAARTMRLPVYEGYGLSECASVVALNTPADDDAGTVGKILPHIRARIENDEIIIENPAFLGYVGTLHDGVNNGVLATGDLGTLDESGRLSITGRRKNVIITSYGRNIAPEWVESILLLHPAVAQAVVHGDAQPHLSAIIVPSAPHAPVAEAVAFANSQLPPYAHIKAFTVSPPFTVENGKLTGTGRPRRAVIIPQSPDHHDNKESVMTFYDRLVKETESVRAALYTVPQLVDGLHGDISRETYIAYLTEAYHHVRHTVRFLMAMGARLPDDRKWLHDSISEYIAEEKGHEEWILNDIAATGADKEAARNAIPSLETQVLIAYNYDYIARKNPIGFLGMVFMLESTSTQIANLGADAVRDKLDLPKSAFTYLYSHGALDQEHMKFFEKTVNRVTDPADQDAIIEVAQNTFRLFANLLRAIPHEGVKRHAA